MENPKHHIETLPLAESKENHDVNNSSKSELSMDEVLLQKLEQTVLDNLDNEQFSVEQLAEDVAMSRSHLHRKLRKLTGRSISQYIRKIRLDRGMNLLKNEVGTVSEIAYRVGFGSSTYFIKCFSEEFGFSPGEAKNQKDVADSKPENTSEVTRNNNVENRIPKPLELLHPASSETLILEIFDEMIAHKPSLEKFTLIEEDEGETVDVRILAYQIFKSFPWPLAVEIRRLFSVALIEPDEKRYNQLRQTILSNLKIIAFIQACEYLQLKQTHDFKGAKLTKELNDLNPTALVKVIQSFHKEIKAQNLGYTFTTELNSILDTSFFRELDEWLVIDSENITSNEVAERCDALEQTMMMLLKKSAFLVGYKLVNVGSIQVLKSKFRTAYFEHNLHILNSSDDNFQLHQEVLEAFSDSNAVLLMKSIKDPGQFLNLSPFIIDTHGQTTPVKGIRKDVYLFEKYDGEHLYASGAESSEIESLEELPNHMALVEEYEEMIKRIES